MFNPLNLLKRKKEYVSISPSIVVFTAIFSFIVYFLFRIQDILTILFLGFIVMVALSPAVDRLEKMVKSRMASIIIVYSLVGVVIVAALAFLLPPLAIQLTQLVRSINLPYFQDELSNLRFTIQEFNQFATSIGSSFNAVFSVINTTFQGAFTFLTLLVISFYLIVDEPNLHLKIGWFTKKKAHFKIARRFLDDIEENLGGWVRGQIVLMTIIGTATYIALTIISVPYALPLALLAGLLEILPNLGPTLSAIPAILVALFYNGQINALIVFAYYVLIQQIENNFIVPRVMKKNADINPLIAILCILTGFKLGNVIGGFLAIPVYILIRTVYGYYLRYEEKLKPDW